MKKRKVQDEALLTVADIRKLQGELEEDERLFGALPERIAEKKNRLNAALLWAPKGFDLAIKHEKKQQHKGKKSAGNGRDTTNPQITRELPVTWTGEVGRILNASPKGLSHKEVLAQAKNTALGERTSAGEKGFYNAIHRLAKSGELVKHGGLLYSKKSADALKANGQMLPDVSADSRRRSGSGGALVVQVLGANTQGLTAPALKNILSKMPNAPESIRAHGQYIYTILGTLIGAGTVTRENGVYRLSQQSIGARH